MPRYPETRSGWKPLARLGTRRGNSVIGEPRGRWALEGGPRAGAAVLGMGGGDDGHRLPCSREGAKEKHPDLSLLPPAICCSQLAKPKRKSAGKKPGDVSPQSWGSGTQNVVESSERWILEDKEHTPIP